MTAGVVADASVAVAWVHPEQATPMSRRLLDAVRSGTVVEVPAIWPLEVANALTILGRRRMLTPKERDAGLAWLSRLQVRIDHAGAQLAFTRLSALAAAEQLSVYDASYLELALRKGLPLACKDGSLRAASGRQGVSLWS